MDKLTNYAQIRFTNAVLIDIFSHYADNAAMAEFVSADGSVDIFLDIFERLPDGNYGRVSESFTERVWSDEEITEMLDSAGLAVLARYDDYTDAPVTDQTERVVYVTKKVK